MGRIVVGMIFGVGVGVTVRSRDKSRSLLALLFKAYPSEAFDARLCLMVSWE